MESYNDNPAFKYPEETNRVSVPPTGGVTYSPRVVHDEPECLQKADVPAISDDPYILSLSKPYLFEGTAYTVLDLSALRDASTAVLLKAEKAWTAKGNMSMQMETNMAYCLEVAAEATGKPISFFEKLPKQDGIAAKALVQRDFFGTMESPERASEPYAETLRN